MGDDAGGAPPKRRWIGDYVGLLLGVIALAGALWKLFDYVQGVKDDQAEAIRTVEEKYDAELNWLKTTHADTLKRLETSQAAEIKRLEDKLVATAAELKNNQDAHIGGIRTDTTNTARRHEDKIERLCEMVSALQLQMVSFTEDALSRTKEALGGIRVTTDPPPPPQINVSLERLDDMLTTINEIKTATHFEGARGDGPCQRL